MSETWKPSEGLKRAETVAAQIKEELAAAGVQIEPMYQWRMAQVIGSAIDEAVTPMRHALDKAMMDVMAKDVRTSYTAPPVTVGTPNPTGAGIGIWRSNADGQFEQVANGLNHLASEISESVTDETPSAGALHAAEQAPKRRGRPPGPGKKKDKKAAKKKADAAAGEATQAA